MGAGLRRIVERNPYCADCGAANPSWAVINLGTLVCITCSGIHRSLGVHISKVRSVTLDEWGPTLVEMMDSIGNDRANALWEHAVDQMEGWAKPGPDAPLEEKERWIQTKYRWRGFLPVEKDVQPPPPPPPPPQGQVQAREAGAGATEGGGGEEGSGQPDYKGQEEGAEPGAITRRATVDVEQARRERLGAQLRTAIEDGDLWGAYALVVRQAPLGGHGGAGCEAGAAGTAGTAGTAGGRKKGETPLHVAAAAGQTAICELLYQNGADAEAVDADGCRPLDAAMVHNQVEVIEWALQEKGFASPGRTLGQQHGHRKRPQAT